MQRRLAAILAADVVDYSRLMGEDQERTLDALRQLRKELFEPVVSDHRGTVVKRMGDGWIVEFASVADAVDCALEIHEGLASHEVIRLRSGIHIGDVVFEEEDVFGDGVNVAARLEELAEPGEVLISDTAHQSLDGKAAMRFSGGNSHQLKNISRSIQVWHWPAMAESGAAAINVASKTDEKETLALPDKPSIAVLAFDNLSNDPEQDYFADGMVEDIITGLSRFSQLFVIARNTTFTYKGRSADVRQIGAELNVRYVLEGSVRKSRNRVRITGQLIDAESGGHVWADRYEGELTDVFALQDRITEAVVGVIEPAIRRADLESARRKSPENMDAYDLYLQALPLAYTRQQDSCAKAFQLLEQAIDYDPTFVPSLALSAWCLEQGITLSWPELTDNDRDIAADRARTVLSINTDDANAIAMAGFSLQMTRLDFESGRSAALRSLKLNPNSVIVQMFAGLTLVFGGDADLARTCFEKALTLSPADPGMPIFLLGIAMVHLLSGHYEEAIEVSLQSAALNPRETVYWCLAAAYASLERKSEVRSTVEQLRLINPNANTRRYWESLPFKDPKIKFAIAGVLAMAGVPE